MNIQPSKIRNSAILCQLFALLALTTPSMVLAADLGKGATGSEGEQSELPSPEFASFNPAAGKQRLVPIKLAPGETKDFSNDIQLIVPAPDNGLNLPFMPNLKLENRDGRLFYHLQGAAPIPIGKGATIKYDLTKFPAVNEEILLAELHDLSFGEDGSASAVFKAGPHVERWSVQLQIFTLTWGREIEFGEMMFPMIMYALNHAGDGEVRVRRNQILLTGASGGPMRFECHMVGERASLNIVSARFLVEEAFESIIENGHPEVGLEKAKPTVMTIPWMPTDKYTLENLFSNW